MERTRPDPVAGELAQRTTHLLHRMSGYTTEFEVRRVGSGTTPIDIIPIPPMMLDFLLALNITVGIIVLITVIYATSPLEFSIFPSLLIFRLLMKISK